MHKIIDKILEQDKVDEDYNLKLIGKKNLVVEIEFIMNMQ
jgi:hypothetical protein